MYKKYTYGIYATLDMGKAVNKVGEVIEGVNKTYKGLGGSGEIVVRSGEFKMYTITCNRIMSEEEKKALKDIVNKEFRGKLPKYDIKVSSIKKER